MTGFDRVARVYRWLEYAAFGGALQRARVAHLGHLRRCADILVLGDGDGRCLAAILRAAPFARIECVDDSQVMIDLAARRLSVADRRRVTFTCTDACTFDPGQRTFDAVVTMFFLDCFVDRDVHALVERLRPQLRHGALWLFADFAIPARGLARWHAQVIVSSLYLFFRLATGLEARALPASEAHLLAAGLRCTEVTTERAGLIRTTVYALST